VELLRCGDPNYGLTLLHCVVLVPCLRGTSASLRALVEFAPTYCTDAPDHESC